MPERERVKAPPKSSLYLLKEMWAINDRELIHKAGLDAFFFLRYLKTLLVIFVPIAITLMPLLISLNYISGRSHSLNSDGPAISNSSSLITTGLDTLAWGNISPTKTSCYWAHLAAAILIVVWTGIVVFFELRVYVKVRQDYLTSAEHRLRASATTVLINNIPPKWLTEPALRGLFDVFPGGVKNVWINRNLSQILDKINYRNQVHLRLESAETELVRSATKAEMTRKEVEEQKIRQELRLKALTREEKASRDVQTDRDAQNVARGMSVSQHRARGAFCGCENINQLGQSGADWQLGGPSIKRDPLSKDLVARCENASYYKLLHRDELRRMGHGVRRAVNKVTTEVEETWGNANGFIAPPGSDSQLKSRGQMDRKTAYRVGTSPGAVRSENTVRELNHEQDFYTAKDTKWWQFWKPPSGSYISPIPQDDKYDNSTQEATGTSHCSIRPCGSSDKTMWQRAISVFPCIRREASSHPPYPEYGRDSRDSQPLQGVWQKYIDERDRPTYRIPPFGVTWLPAIPLLSKKVDAILWHRRELARLNMEIEEDQRRQDSFPIMNSAFVQFHCQVAAHMACQSEIYHIPKSMAPRMVEISPNHIIWSNIGLTWREEWLRTAAVIGILALMGGVWAVPVAWTGIFSQIGQVMQASELLLFIQRSQTAQKVIDAFAGVLPTVALATILFLLPYILDYLAEFKGAKTKVQKGEFVQTYYFIFLFTQLFLVVSIASFFASSFKELVLRLGDLKTAGDVMRLLAVNLPKGANYFFSYMVLQALSASSATLLQYGTLISWFFIARIFDATAREKWARNTTIGSIRLGALFPVYTNFACIALIYSVIAPLISLLAVLTFGLLWLAQRYALLYVTRLDYDTGGTLYPRAINQTFTGVYVMELCVTGLFFIARDERGTASCTPQAIIMSFILVATAIYQILLNKTFSPLFHHLPITFEDEAILRDQAFERAQSYRHESSIRPGDTLGSVPDARVEHRGVKRAMTDALFGGIPDELEDLEAWEREQLVIPAFQHEAIRSRRPIVWIPRDNLGISLDEIEQTRKYSEYIAITDEGTAVDSKGRVVYGKNPPDFSMLDHISL